MSLQKTMNYVWATELKQKVTNTGKNEAVV